MGIAVVGDGRWDARLTYGSDMPSEIYKMNLTPPSLTISIIFLNLHIESNRQSRL